ncbi:hypothetical protein D3C86_1327810 [compost metagenome]
MGLHPRGEVDRLTLDRVVALLLAAHRAGDDQAGVQPHPDPQADAGIGFEPVGEDACRLLHLPGGGQGSLRIVLVGDRRPEEGHDRVPDVLVDHPAEAVDGLGEHLEEAVDDGRDGFGIELLAHGGEARHVGEEHRHHPAIAGAGADADEARPALGAKTGMGDAGRLAMGAGHAVLTRLSRGKRARRL